jgi:hypothetical protein
MQRLVRNCFCILLISSLLVTVVWGQSTFDQFADKFGKESRIWISEPGDTGFNRWNPRELFEDNGILLDWDSKGIVLFRAASKSQVTIPGDCIVRIEPAFANESGETIHRLFLQREFKAVVTKGQEVLNNSVKSGLPNWQLRLILAEMIESCSALAKPHIAGPLFVSLSKGNPPLLLYVSIPLPWGETPFSELDSTRMQPLAEDWINQESESAQLLGAAWLLAGTKRNLAIETLEQLAKNSKSPMVVSYAKAQLWRTVPPAEILSDRYPRWLSERDKLMLPAQAGPTMLLAERLQQAGQTNLAIPEWLRIATMHTDRYHLATKAIPRVTEALRASSRDEDADRVQTLLDRFKKENTGNQ